MSNWLKIVASVVATVAAVAVLFVILPLWFAFGGPQSVEARLEGSVESAHFGSAVVYDFGARGLFSIRYHRFQPGGFFSGSGRTEAKKHCLGSYHFASGKARVLFCRETGVSEHAPLAEEIDVGSSHGRSVLLSQHESDPLPGRKRLMDSLSGKSRREPATYYSLFRPEKSRAPKANPAGALFPVRFNKELRKRFGERLARVYLIGPRGAALTLSYPRQKNLATASEVSSYADSAGLVVRARRPPSAAASGTYDSVGVAVDYEGVRARQGLGPPRKQGAFKAGVVYYYGPPLDADERAVLTYDLQSGERGRLGLGGKHAREVLSRAKREPGDTLRVRRRLSVRRRARPRGQEGAASTRLQVGRRGSTGTWSRSDLPVRPLPLLRRAGHVN